MVVSQLGLSPTVHCKFWGGILWKVLKWLSVSNRERWFLYYYVFVMKVYIKAVESSSQGALKLIWVLIKNLRRPIYCFLHKMKISGKVKWYHSSQVVGLESPSQYSRSALISRGSRNLVYVNSQKPEQVSLWPFPLFLSALSPRPPSPNLWTSALWSLL